jgi:hypothetical protein
MKQTFKFLWTAIPLADFCAIMSAYGPGGLHFADRSGWEQNMFLLNSSILRDITPCNPLKVNRRFGRILSPVSCWFSACSLLQPCRWHVPPKRRWTINGPQDALTQEAEFFMVTADRTSNLTQVIDFC